MSTVDLQHTIDFQLKQPLAMCVQGKYYRAALILIYSGIDAMGNLIRDIDKNENDRDDFIKWVLNYLIIQGIHQTEVAPEEWWSARCGLIHTQTYLSRDVKNKKCRVINYMNGLENPTIRFDASIDDSQVIVSIIALAEAFLIGVDQTIEYLINNTELSSVSKKRLKDMYINVPMQQGG